MFTNPEFWIAVSFVIALAILVKLAGGTFIGALDAHAARIAAQLDEAGKLREEAEALLAEQQRKQRDALNEAKDIIAHAHSEAERISGEAAADLERSLRLRELHAKESIALSEAKAVTEVRGVVVDIATGRSAVIVHVVIVTSRGRDRGGVRHLVGGLTRIGSKGCTRRRRVGV